MNALQIIEIGLKVWVLLQPRDFINSHQLLVALGLMVVGILVACVTGQANLAESAPPIANLADTLDFHFDWLAGPNGILVPIAV